MVDACDSGTASVEYKIQSQHITDFPETKHEDLCIYRVPPNLRQVNPKAYTPQLVSIGPFHHGKPQFKAMETQKTRYYIEFQKRINSGRSFGNFKDNIIKTVQDIRKCYAEKSMLDDKKFADIIELDAVFIMEFFLRLKEKKNQHKDDYVLSTPWLKEGIILDLILLENQLPIKVLNELYTFQGEKECSTFLDLARIMYSKPPNMKIKTTEAVKHLTDLLRCSCISPDFRPDNSNDSLNHNSSSAINPSRINSRPDNSDDNDNDILYSATKLRDSGISFKAVQGRDLLDINFEDNCCLYWPLSWLTRDKIAKARLEIPKLIIDDGTECKFRNLTAFEQCRYPDNQFYICDYVSFIDGLIETKEDVDFLLEKKIFANYLGSNDAAEKMVNRLGRELVTSSSCYKTRIRQLNAHYDNTLNHTMATLRSVYFKDLWRASSTIVGLAVLAFTFVNFFQAILKKVELV
ncbi:hypothetical protein O6P43_017317 [Quillaja saponaria]|uniref:Uncharacterized protein n=1 Tax=Quillaja saponaria TaxID=32244 RepID=A0AAD7LS50_QUISA|nr:hypothetical protein O6P43_017317 [Quillaja saponaria]